MITNFNVETNFLESENLFQQTGVPRFLVERLKTQYFHKKLSCQKPLFTNFNAETNFLESENLFQQTGVPRFLVERLKTHYFHKKLSCQKPLLRQIEW